MRDRRQAGFTIPITMLLVSVLMVLSTAIVAMTVSSFRDAARTRNRAEILNVSEIGLKMAIAEIMPGLSMLPNTYWSFATTSVDPQASSSVSTAAPPAPGSKDLTHEVQLFANVRNWPPFADWTAWADLGTYPTNVKTDNPHFREWTRGWWPVPRNNEYDDAYFGEDASEIGGKAYPNRAPGTDRAEDWLINNPDNDTPAGRAQLAFPVRLGTSSIPVRNWYWYWLTEISPNIPTNTQLRNGGLKWINSPPRLGPPNDANLRAERDVGIGAWKNRVEYSDGAVDQGPYNYDGKPDSDFWFRRDRYNFLNTPVLKKIYTVEHRGTKIRVAVYVRMLLREYYLDPDANPPAYPADFNLHMRTARANGGPNVVFYLVAVNESTPNQRGVRVQQAIYVPMGPANAQDLDASLADSSLETRFSARDGRMFPGSFDLLMDKQLMAEATISGRLLPASGDLSYRLPTTQQYNVRTDVNTFHPNWVYLIEWNGIEPFIEDYGGEYYLSTNSALIWRVPGTNNWRRTPFRNPTTNAPLITGPLEGGDPGNGATPSAYATMWGRFEIGHTTDRPFLPNPPTGAPIPLESGWRGPGRDAWGRANHPAASMSYFLATELQVPQQINSNARYSRPATATRAISVIPPTPAP